MVIVLLLDTAYKSFVPKTVTKLRRFVKLHVISWTPGLVKILLLACNVFTLVS